MQDVRLKLNQPIEQCRLFMVFDGRWKYIHASGFRPMLYDLQSDPQEFADRGEDPACAEIIARLRAALFDWALHPKMHITISNEKIARLCGRADAGSKRHPDRHLDEAELASIHQPDRGAVSHAVDHEKILSRSCSMSICTGPPARRI